MPAGLPSASRSAPRAVAPVVHQGVRYEQVIGNAVPGLPADGRYLAAFDAAGGQLLWTLKVYDQPSIPGLEKDVQSVFFRSMELLPDGGALLIVSETGRRYRVDLARRSVGEER